MTDSDNPNRAIAQALNSWRQAGLDQAPKYSPSMEANLGQAEQGAETPSPATEIIQNVETQVPLVTEPVPKTTQPSLITTPNPTNASSSFNMTDNNLIESSDPVEALAMLQKRVAQCRLCKVLPETRTQTVFGVGNPRARLLFLGEAPGADEDAQGIPFVGRSGRLLTDMIEKGMKISRDEVYICNVLRCRPPQNRNPLPEEAAFCRPFMEAQIKIVNPEFICCLGAVAAKNLLQTDTSIGKLRGTIHNWQGYKVVCTYHPSYLLRNPPAKKDAWIDLQLLMRAMGLM
ncbi:MAG: uracil-DNA glycosylase [Thermoguttaceae bacterium]|nr:uracil-DNA glycosylase [Thermoguttaceae bacterium]